MHAIDELGKFLNLIPASWSARMPTKADLDAAKIVVETHLKDALNAVDEFKEVCLVSETQASSIKDSLERAGRIASEGSYSIAQLEIDNARKKLMELVCPTGI